MSGDRVEFEWDPDKATANLAKHGVSFQLAATVFASATTLTVFDDAHSADEPRWFTLGLAANGTLLAVAHTHKEGDALQPSVIRVISARRATPRERVRFAEALH